MSCTEKHLGSSLCHIPAIVRVETSGWTSGEQLYCRRSNHLKTSVTWPSNVYPDRSLVRKSLVPMREDSSVSMSATTTNIFQHSPAVYVAEWLNFCTLFPAGISQPPPVARTYPEMPRAVVNAFHFSSFPNESHLSCLHLCPTFFLFPARITSFGGEGMGADNFLCVESAKVEGGNLAAGKTWTGKMKLLPA